MTNPDNPDDDKSFEILDAIYHEAALVEAKHGETTDDDRRWSKAFRARMQARIAEARRNLLPTSASATNARPIRPSILAMARDALIAGITEIADRMSGKVQVAHRNFSGHSDDDLRRVLETLMSNDTSGSSDAQ